MKNSRVRNLIEYVLPTILSSLSIFLFTIVDGIFVGRGAGMDALGAVNIAFPYVMIFSALTMLTTIGGLTISAIRMGREDEEGANRVFMQSFALTMVISVFFCLAGVLFTKPIAVLLGANENFLRPTCDYLFWYAAFMIPIGAAMSASGFARTDGAPVLVSAGLIISTLINIFLDWLLIFPLQMGLKGAAIATGIAQTIGSLITLTHFFLKRGKLHFAWFRFEGSTVKKMLLRGAPECVAQFGVPLSTILTNTLLVRMQGDTAVNVYSIICYIACFSVSIFSGTAEGLQPLLGKSYGAKEEKDLKYYLHAGLIIAVTGSVLVTGGILLLSRPICVLFGAEGETLERSVSCMPKYAWGFVVQAANVIISGYLYSTTRTAHALIINILRSFVVNSLVILILPRIFGPEIIWYTFGIYEAVVLVVSVFLLFYADRNGAITGERE